MGEEVMYFNLNKDSKGVMDAAYMVLNGVFNTLLTISEKARDPSLDIEDQWGLQKAYELILGMLVRALRDLTETGSFPEGAEFLSKLLKSCPPEESTELLICTRFRQALESARDALKMPS